MPNRLPKIITRDQASTLLSQPNTKCPPGNRCIGIRNRAMMECMYRGGLRSMEIRNLRPEDLKLDENRLDIRKSKRKKSRVVYVPDETVMWLRQWERIRRKASRRFFHTVKGFPLSSRYLRQMIDTYAEKAGIPKSEVSPHVLRHTYATELIEEGFNIEEVRVMMGHAWISTTQIYLHVRDGELRDKVLGRGKRSDVVPASVERAVAAMGDGQREALMELLKRD